MSVVSFCRGDHVWLSRGASDHGGVLYRQCEKCGAWGWASFEHPSRVRAYTEPFRDPRSRAASPLTAAPKAHPDECGYVRPVPRARESFIAHDEDGDKIAARHAARRVRSKTPATRFIYVPQHSFLDFEREK